VTADGPRDPGTPPARRARWALLYALVLAALVACIAALAWLTERYR
jgi:hypothetical protein